MPVLPISDAVHCNRLCSALHPSSQCTASSTLIHTTFPANVCNRPCKRLRGKPLSFIIPFNGVMLKSSVSISYEDDGIVGSPSSPFAITYGEDSIETDITGVNGSDSQESWYTIDGIRLSGRPTLPGVYFRLTSGVNRKSEKIVIK